MIWIIIVLAFLLRVINLNQSLWLDEATQVILSSKTIYSIWFERAVDFHPPLSYLLMHFWLKFGNNEIWLRLFSVLFGVGTIFGLYLLAKEMFNKKIALFSALLLAIAPYHIYYSQEIRMYSLATFLATFSMYFFCLLLKQEKIRWWVCTGFILSSTSLLFTHYLGVMVIITQIVLVFLTGKKKIGRFIKSFIPIFILGAFWLPQFLIQLQGGLGIDQYLPGWRNALGVSVYKMVPTIFLKFTIGRISFDNKIFYLFIAIIVLSIFGFFITLGIKKIWRLKEKIIIFWLFLPIILSLLVSFKIPLDQPFRLLFLLPAFYLIIAVGVFELQRFKSIGILAVISVSLFGLSVYLFTPYFWREDWKGTVSFINNNLKDEEEVVFAWSDSFPPYQYYYGDKRSIGIVSKFPADQSEVDKNLNLLSYKKGFYFLEYLQPLSDPNRYINKWFNGHGYNLKKVYNFNGVGFVYYYTKND